eukprot:6066229-Lingulodinium_polyedra.AAC.1
MNTARASTVITSITESQEYPRSSGASGSGSGGGGRAVDLPAELSVEGWRPYAPAAPGAHIWFERATQRVRCSYIIDDNKVTRSQP